MDKTDDVTNRKFDFPLLSMMLNTLSLAGVLTLSYRAGGFVEEVEQLKIKMDKQDVVLDVMRDDVLMIKNQVYRNTNVSTNLENNHTIQSIEIKKLKDEQEAQRRCLIALSIGKTDDFNCEQLRK